MKFVFHFLCQMKKQRTIKGLFAKGETGSHLDITGKMRDFSILMPTAFFKEEE